MRQNIDTNIWKFNLALFLRAIILLSPVLLLFYQENGLTVKDLFFFQGIFYLTSILSELPVGYISDAIPRKFMLLISFVIYFGINFMWLNWHGFGVILLGEILFAISKVMMDNAMSGYVYDYLDTKNKINKMTNYYGYLNCFLSLGTAVAALVGAFLYSKFGSSTLLKSEMIIISVSIVLISLVPTIRLQKTCFSSIKDRIFYFGKMLVTICRKKQIKYYILYSGILTSVSILFALSFQPLMQKSMVPVFMFGVVAFLNHGTRSLSGIIAGKYCKNFNIKKMAKLLLFIFIIGFGLIFWTFYSKNPFITVLLLFIICLIICMQLIFTIMHVSRLYKFVNSNERGSVIAVNNFVSRSITAMVLISSKFFLNDIRYWVIILTFFILVGTFAVCKIDKTGEKV